MPEIPPEAQELIKKFNQEEAQREAERPRSNSPSKKQLNRSRSREIAKPMTANEMASYARSKGFSVRGGNGGHGVHIEALNGLECSLPVHGSKALHTGTQHTIMQFISKNGVSKN